MFHKNNGILVMEDIVAVVAVESRPRSQQQAVGFQENNQLAGLAKEKTSDLLT